MDRYPVGRTGTAQDLMGILTGASDRICARDHIVLPHKHPAARLLLEAPFNLCGIFLRWVLELAPADAVLALHDRIYRLLAGGRTYPFDEASPALARAKDQALLLQEQGREPALLSMISHPAVLGEMAHLNFELVRHACRALRLVRGRPCRPRLVVAVDPFALDTASLAAEGAYAGFMGLYHLGLDRLAFSRSGHSSCLVAKTAWPNLIWRLLRRLAGGGEAAMAVSGGVPATARVLYTTREWVGRHRRLSARRGQPEKVLSGLRGFADFRKFESDGPHSEDLRSNAWRMVEGWAMSAVAEHLGGEPSCAETGVLTPRARQVLESCLEALDVPSLEQDAALLELSEEFQRETPFRRRLFQIVAGRMLRHGRPVMFLPVVHRDVPRLGVEVKEAWCWLGMTQGVIQARRLGAQPHPWQGTAEDFAVEFGRENYL